MTRRCLAAVQNVIQGRAMTAVPAPPAPTHEPSVGRRPGPSRRPSESKSVRPRGALLLALVRGVDRLAGHPTSRRVTLGTLELGIALLAASGAALVVYGGGLHPSVGSLLGAVVFLVGAKVASGLGTDLFRSRWRYVGIPDALMVVRSTLLAGIAGLAGLQSLALA